MSRSFFTIEFLTIVLLQAAAPAAEFDHSHRQWDQLLQKHVRAGKVNYRGIIVDSDSFNQYLAQLASVSLSDYRRWSRERKLAYWINAYNAFAVASIVDHYPIKKGRFLKARFYPDNSIQQIEDVWDDRKHKAATGRVSLNHIEHEILRKELREPRIHFAIVCASIGCPHLWNHAYTAANVDKELEEAAERFVKDDRNVKVDFSDEEIHLSKIFNWFSEDFERFAQTGNYGKYDGVISYCLRYFPEPIRRRLLKQKLDIEWIDYDWTLNEM